MLPRPGGAMKIPLQAYAQVLTALQRAPVPGDGQEKRRATRMNVETTVPVTLLGGGGGGGGPRTIKAISRDISQSGLGMIIGSATKCGDRLVVHLPRGASQPPMLVLAVVKLAAEPADGVFKVGVEFVKELTQDELTSLKSTGDEVGRIQKSILSAA